ncbi:ORF188 [Saltwater crocodilepox virus]|nr:ORF188 [Saltwater crocodilepox virus]
MAGAEPEWSDLLELINDLWQVKPEDYLFTRRDAKIIRNYFIKVMDSESDPKDLLISSKNRDNQYITSTIFTTDVNSDLYKKQNVPMTADISAVTLRPSTATDASDTLKLYVERRSLFFPMTVRGNILELTDHARSSLIGYNGGTIIASNKISYPDVLPEPENLPTIDKGLTMVVAENEGITETELAMLYQSFDEDVTEVLDKVVQVADTHENTTNANSRQDGHLETIRKILVALNAKIDRVAANRLGTIL